MAQSLNQSMTHLTRDYGSGDQLGMRMLQAGPCIRTVIFENRDVVDPLVGTERVVSFLVDSQNFAHVLVRQKSHATGVVRPVNNHFVKAKTIDAAPQMLQTAGRLHFTGERGEFIGNHSHRPGFPFICGKARHLRRCLIFVSGTERASLHKGWHDLCRSMCCQLFRTFGALGGNNDPFFGEEILA